MQITTIKIRRIISGKIQPLILLLLCVLILTFSCISGPGTNEGKTAEEEPAALKLKEKAWPLLTDHELGISNSPVPPDDSRYRWDGRVDQSNPAVPVFTWSGAAVISRFRGSAISVHFQQGSGQNWFNLIVDGKMYIFNALSRKTFTLKEGLTDGEHTVQLFKRSEAQSGKIAFLGFSVPGGDLLEPPAPPTRRLEFLGDSITAGACNEDVAEDQWGDRSTHNFYNSYAAITARALDASLVATVNSGTGVTIGWSKDLASEIWNRQDLHPSSAIAPPADPAPDAYIINLGENDQSYTSAKSLPFPKNFTEEYVNLVRMVRKRYPSTLIICSVGGMSVGHPSSILSKPWKKAMDELMADDDRIRSFRFKTSSSNHPRVSTHQDMAGELIAFLCEELGWEKTDEQ